MPDASAFNVNIFLVNPKGGHRIYLKEARVKDKKLTVLFTYQDLKKLKVEGEIKARIDRGTINVEDLKLRSERFFAQAGGQIKQQNVNLKLLLRIPPVRTKNLTIETLNAKAKIKGKLPELFIHGDELKIKNIRVGERDYGQIIGNFSGKIHIGKGINVKASLTSEEGALANVNLKGNTITFNFKNLIIDKKTLRVNTDINALTQGEGSYNLKLSRLELITKSERIKLGKEELKGEAQLLYILKKKRGDIHFFLENRGKLWGFLKLNKNTAKGELILEDFRLALPRVSGVVDAHANLSKEEKLKLTADFTIQKPTVFGFLTHTLRGKLTLLDKHLKLELSAGRSRALIEGTPEDLRARFVLSDFLARSQKATLLVKRGRGELRLKEGKISARASLGGVSLRSERVNAKGELNLRLRKEKELELSASGIADAELLGKVNLKDFVYRLKLKNDKLTLRGRSQNALVRLNYEPKEKNGDFLVSYREKETKLRASGKIKEGALEASYLLSFSLLSEELTIRGSAKARGDELSLSVLPLRKRGKRLALDFRGLSLKKSSHEISLNFGGLSVLLLGRPLLSFSQAVGRGTLSNFSLEPIKLSGVL
ncbi:MAG: hypothetical protein GXO04_06210, partial [Aquificae bacterium]|nr:hypothetical protein [Aquificota bacterium]